MRPLLLSDVSVAARVLLPVPEAAREDLCRALLRQAEFADRYTRRLKKPHPVWGNGTLLAAASGHRTGAERGLDDAEYRMCFQIVLRCICEKQAAASCNLRLHGHMVF